MVVFDCREQQVLSLNEVYAVICSFSSCYDTVLQMLFGCISDARWWFSLWSTVVTWACTDLELLIIFLSFLRRLKVNNCWCRGAVALCSCAGVATGRIYAGPAFFLYCLSGAKASLSASAFTLQQSMAIIFLKLSSTFGMLMCFELSKWSLVTPWSCYAHLKWMSWISV